MEDEVVVRLKARVFSADPVHHADELPQAVRASDLPVTDLVLFRVQVLFLSGYQRTVLAELVGGPVDPVAGSQRRGQSYNFV